MYYDDESRRFNFISGLLLGAILGAGVALLISPWERLRKPRTLRNSADRLRDAAANRVERLRKQAKR